MPKFSLALKADLENLREVRPLSDSQWHIKFKCLKCREDASDSYTTMRASEVVPIPNSRGECHLVMKCTFCKAEANASIDAASITSYTSSGAFQSIVRVESRGVEPFDWKCEEPMTATSTSDQEFLDASLDGEFCDYDERGKVPVSIMNVEFRVDKI
ncbi:hypothetical protein SeMB42_g02958 [Synchytrium endobioticum]|nr:hypothetical protein SeMB42_g02958 [Synchytrium endobioticum]